jgi:hypothetical protein
LDAIAALELLFVATFRDWVIIFMGIAVGAFFLVALIIAIVLGLLMRALLKKVGALVDDDVKPLLGTTRETVSNVKGTTSYVSQSAVQPIIRTYGVVAGVRRAASVLTGLTGASTDNARPGARAASASPAPSTREGAGAHADSKTQIDEL